MGKLQGKLEATKRRRYIGGFSGKVIASLMVNCSAITRLAVCHMLSTLLLFVLIIWMRENKTTPGESYFT